MGKTLYLECYSGISGDMTVAALLDLGADRLVLDRVLKSLKVSGFETKISRVVKSGIDACDFDVVHRNSARPSPSRTPWNKRNYLYYRA